MSTYSVASPADTYCITIICCIALFNSWFWHYPIQPCFRLGFYVWMHAFDACCLLFSFVYQLTIHTIFFKFSHNFKKVNLYFYKLSIQYRLWFFYYTSLKYAHFVKIIHLLAVILACLFLIEGKHNYIKNLVYLQIYKVHW